MSNYQKYEAMLQRVRELRSEKNIDVVQALITVLDENDPMSYKSLCEFRRMISQQECNILPIIRPAQTSVDLATTAPQSKSVCSPINRENIATGVENSIDQIPVESTENQNISPILGHPSHNDVKVRFNNLSEIIDTSEIGNEEKIAKPNDESQPAEKSRRSPSILKKSSYSILQHISLPESDETTNDHDQIQTVTKSAVDVAAGLCRKLEEISKIHNNEMLNETIVSKMDELRDVMRQGGSLGALQVIAEDVVALQRRAEREFHEEHEWKERTREKLLRDVSTVGVQCTDVVTSQFIQRLHAIISRLHTPKLTRNQMINVFTDVWEGLEKIQSVLSDKTVVSINIQAGTESIQEINPTEHIPLELVVIRTVQNMHLFLKMFPNHPDVEFVRKMKNLLRYSCEQLKDEIEIEKNARSINLCLMAINENIQQ